MRKLMSANLSLLFKSRLFKIEFFFFAAMSVWLMFVNYSPELQEAGHRLYLENSFFNLYQLFGIISAATISLIVGTEYSDGTLRNKIVIGHARSSIYFSILLTNLILSGIMIAVHGITSFTAGYFLFGMPHIKYALFIKAILCSVLNIAVITAFYTAIGMNCSNKPVSAVISLLLSFLLAFIAGFLDRQLLEPEFTPRISIVNDTIQYGDLIPNPAYLTGSLRTAVQFFYDLLPDGQLMQIQQLRFDSLTLWPLFSVPLFVLISLAGYYLFSIKDIR